MSDEKFLSFEDPIKELAQKLSALRTASVDSPALNTEIQSLEKENRALTKKIYSKLDTWQSVQVARQPNTPHSSDYIKRIFVLEAGTLKKVSKKELKKIGIVKMINSL